ncbi:deoxyribose-phosphate aldolase [Candidatus Woesearchaeota archaeon]|nr:deoxyribose-phosphate aldolase [Candidatus Woesearchaeota archaeon]
MAEEKPILTVKIDGITPAQVASVCDHTFLSRQECFRKEGANASDARKEEFENFISEMLAGPLPYAICVRPEDVKHAKKRLKKQYKTGMVIASVVGFPDGSWYSTKFKAAEAKLAIKDGASEIDMVLNINKLKQGKLAAVEKDVAAVVKSCHKRGALLKLILETSELTDDEIVACCKIAEKAEADFVKTSTGFSSAGAKAEHLKLMRKNFSRGIKMSGGVNKENLQELLAAASGRDDGMIELDPMKVRIGESSLLKGMGGSY